MFSERDTILVTSGWLDRAVISNRLPVRVGSRSHGFCRAGADPGGRGSRDGAAVAEPDGFGSENF